MRRLITISNLNDSGLWWWTQPSMVYRGEWNTIQEAVTHICLGRSCFLPLIAITTYAFLAVSARMRSDQYWDWHAAFKAGWHIATRDGKKDLTWLDQVLESCVTDFSLPRIGGIISWHKAEYFARMIPFLTQTNARVVLFWGTPGQSQSLFYKMYSTPDFPLDQLASLHCFPPKNLHRPLLALSRGSDDHSTKQALRTPSKINYPLRPLNRQPIIASTKVQDSEEEPVSSWSFPAPPSDEHQNHPPQPAATQTGAYPRRLASKHPREFVEERRQQYSELLASASPADRQKWQNRNAMAYVKGECIFRPRAHSCFLWMWENNWYRMRLTIHETDECWEDFATTQKYFYPVTSTWELCEDLDPEAAAPMSVGIEDDYDDLPVMNLSQLQAQSVAATPDAAFEACHLKAIQLGEHDREERYQGRTEKKFIDENPRDFVQEAQLATDFYGVIYKAVDQISHSAAWPPTEETKMVFRAIGVLFGESHLFRAPPAQQTHLRKFMSTILIGNLPPSCDLFHGGSSRLCAPHHLGFTITRLKTGAYLLRHTSPPLDVSFDISAPFDGVVFHEASSLVYLLRMAQNRDAPLTFPAIGKILVEQGMAFNLAVRCPASFQGQAEDLLRDGVIGLREEGYTGTRPEYLAFHEARDDLFASKARAALLAGGLAWRMAQDYLADHDIMELLLSGPAMLNRCLGKDNEGYGWWDEGLSSYDRNILSGVYEVGNCKYWSFQVGALIYSPLDSDHDSRANKHASWWPKINGHWRTSGINLGHWSRDTEDWYQRRRQVLNDPNSDSPCKNMNGKKGWNVKFSDHNKKLVLHYNTLCEIWLSAYIESSAYLQ